MIVRDFQHNKAYYGWLAAHSVGNAKDELLLFNVIVMENETGKQIGNTGAVYIPMKRENLLIEFVDVDYNKWS